MVEEAVGGIELFEVGPDELVDGLAGGWVLEGLVSVFEGIWTPEREVEAGKRGEVCWLPGRVGDRDVWPGLLKLNPESISC